LRVAGVIAAVVAVLAAAAPAHAGAGLQDFSCVVSTPARPPLLTQGAPSPELVARLGVLRRPRAVGDLLPDLGRASDLARIDVRYIRRTPGEVGADQFYVVTGNYPRTSSRPPRHCLRGLNARTRRFLIREWRELAKAPTDVLCLFEYQGDGARLRESCVMEPAERLDDGLVVGPARTRGRLTQVAGIVPDGVASVEARYRTGPPRTATVVDNVWALADLRRADRVEPEQLVWLDAAGAPVKSFAFDEVAFRR
jgi:hypothetical protein